MTLNGYYKPGHTVRKSALTGAGTFFAALAALAAASPTPLASLTPNDAWPAALVSVLAAAARAFLNWRKHRHRPRRLYHLRRS